MPENEVIRTDPRRRHPVSTRASTCRCASRSAPPPIEVPEVANQAEAAAIAALEAADWSTARRRARTHRRSRPASVIRTNPKAGDSEFIDAEGKVVKIRKGQTIDLVISNGLVTIPDVSGQKAADAANTLRGQLLLNVTLVGDSGCTGGTGERAVPRRQQPAALGHHACATARRLSPADDAPPAAARYEAAMSGVRPCAATAASGRPATASQLPSMPVAALGEHRLRVELHAVERSIHVLHAHDDAALRARGHHELVGHGRVDDRERVVPRGAERLRHAVVERAVVVA